MNESWLNLLRDPSWGFVAVVLALIALVVAIWAAIRSVKAIEYVIDQRQILSMADDLGGRLRILYDGSQRTNIWSVAITLRHTGTVPIAASDFHRPLQITFESAEILKAGVARALPSGLDLDVSYQGGTATLAPTLLNPGDQFSIVLLVSDYAAPPSLNYRVLGLIRMLRVGEFARRDLWTRVLASALTIPTCLGMIYVANRIAGALGFAEIQFKWPELILGFSVGYAVIALIHIALATSVARRPLADK